MTPVANLTDNQIEAETAEIEAMDYDTASEDTKSRYDSLCKENARRGRTWLSQHRVY